MDLASTHLPWITIYNTFYTWNDFEMYNVPSPSMTPIAYSEKDRKIQIVLPLLLDESFNTFFKDDKTEYKDALFQR